MFTVSREPNKISPKEYTWEEVKIRPGIYKISQASPHQTNWRFITVYPADNGKPYATISINIFTVTVKVAQDFSWTSYKFIECKEKITIGWLPSPEG